MDKSYIKKTSIDGVYIIERPTFEDDRGFFRETFRMSDLEEVLGKAIDIKQENHSRSKKNVLRGIHVAPWSKLIDVKKGEVQAVFVDLRADSPTYLKHESIIIGDSNKAKIYLPPGVGNAYLVLSDSADYTYLTDAYWVAGKEYGVIWNDPALGIPWQINNPILSEKDLKNPFLKEVLKRE